MSKARIDLLGLVCPNPKEAPVARKTKDKRSEIEDFMDIWGEMDRRSTGLKTVGLLEGIVV
jgi:hypothetical protein